MIVPREIRPVGASEEWLSHVPELVDDLCEEWHLSVDDESVRGGAWGIVVACHTEDGLEAVLKLCANHERLRAEAAALMSWRGGPAIRVFDHQPGALLLERARPGSPERLAPSQLGMLLNALHRPAKTGFAGLGDWRTSINAAVGQVPSLHPLGNELLRGGEKRPIVTLHGDLQPSNVLRHRGASVVIDPLGIAGPREFDVAMAGLYNNWGEDSAARIIRLAQLTGTDASLALRFGQFSAMYAALARRS
jgi:streptomycin 6-kinase